MPQFVQQHERRLPSIRLVELGRQRQGAREAAGRLTVGESADGVAGCDAKVGDRLPRLGAPLEMKRELGGDAIDGGPVHHFALLGDPRVQAHAPDRGHALVQDLLKQRVRERVSWRPCAIGQAIGSGGANELPVASQPVQPGLDARPVDLQRRRDGRRREIRSAHAGGFEDTLLIRRAAVRGWRR